MPFGGRSSPYKKTAQEVEVQDAQIRRAYGWNYYDTEIAVYAGCSVKTVTRWRERHGLPSNYTALEGLGAASPQRAQ